MNSFETTDEAYRAALLTLLDSPDFVTSPRGLPCSELMNWQFVIGQPSSGPIVTTDDERNKVMASYLKVETRLYLSGELRAEVWSRKASRLWGKLANPDGTINSNYGWLTMYDRSLPDYRTPWEWARDSLLADPATRQAYVKFAKRDHLRDGNRDQVCTLHLMFMLRARRLHATAVMRSNDVVKGLAYDMPWFCLMLAMMHEELDRGGLHLDVGTYTHLAHSLHLYDRDRRMAEKMVGR